MLIPCHSAMGLSVHQCSLFVQSFPLVLLYKSSRIRFWSVEQQPPEPTHGKLKVSHHQACSIRYKDAGPAADKTAALIFGFVGGTGRNNDL